MRKVLYRPIEKLITRILSWWVKPDVLPADPAVLLNPDLPVLYILEKVGMADRATLNLVCEKYGLPTPSDALVYGDAQESSSVDVLKHRRGLIFRQHRLVQSKRLKRIIQTRLRDAPGELQIVPVAVYWGRAPNKEQSVWSLFFSENWQIGGRTRKFITTLLYGRDTLLSISEPLSLNTLVQSTTNDITGTQKPIDDSLIAERLQHKLSRILRVHFRQRRIASLGPDPSHRRMLVSHVMADPGVRLAIQHEVGKENKKLDRVQARANKYALEIAADVSYPTVRVLHRLMNRLWTELYDGVKLSGIHRLKSVADGKEVVYVPCHRSHIDYLLLSYILYINGFSLPHIAAGINLNLPVVGGILRRGGAFFLRRSFAGNKLYAAVFNAYLKEILQRGHALEYFVEGGRSRTGRSLPPKGGMLAMTAHAYLRNPRTPVVFIPVYFGYERLLEGRAFTSELAGGKKQKESVFGLLKSLKTLREEYGNVYVNFGEPIELDALLDKHQSNWRADTVELTRPEWLSPVIDDLGENIMQNINDAACVTPISLLAMGLLSTRQGKLGTSELIDQMRVYHSLFLSAALNSTAVVPEIDFQQAIEHGKKLGFIQTSEDPLGTLVSIKPGMSAPMTYFRNNVQHLIMAPALVACCFSGRAVRSYEELERLVGYAYPFLQNELYLTPKPAEQTLDDALRSLVDSKLIQIDDTTGQSNDLGNDQRSNPNNNETDEQSSYAQTSFRRASGGSIEAVTLMRLAESVMPALERYLLAAAVLVQSGTDGLPLDTLAQQCEACAERLALTQGRDAVDLYDKHLHKAMVSKLTQSQYVSVENDHIVATQQFLTLAADTRSLVTEQMRQAILHAASHFS